VLSDDAELITKTLMDENSTVEIEDNKIYEFWMANVGEHFSLSVIKSKSHSGIKFLRHITVNDSKSDVKLLLHITVNKSEADIKLLRHVPVSGRKSGIHNCQRK